MIDLRPGVAADEVVRRAKDRGVLVGVWTPTRIRAATHLDVDAAAVERAAGILQGVLESL
jgi:threonine aldolase